MSLRRRGLRAIMLGGLTALMVVAFGAASAWAEPSTYCVKATKVLTPKKHFTGGFNDKGCTSVNSTHEGKFEKLASFTAPEESQLKALLKYMTVQSSGVGSKPTVQFSGANVQIVNGEGKTTTTNGAGNLVLGYDERWLNCMSVCFEEPYTQTGSHDLVLGTGNSFTSYGGLVGGKINDAAGPYASVLGGSSNTASGGTATVTGGAGNTASGNDSAVGGGLSNKAEGQLSSIQGGVENSTSTNSENASISGGSRNNITEAGDAWIGGGVGNSIPSFKGFGAAIFGGKGLAANAEYEFQPAP